MDDINDFFSDSLDHWHQQFLSFFKNNFPIFLQRVDDQVFIPFEHFLDFRPYLDFKNYE